MDNKISKVSQALVDIGFDEKNAVVIGHVLQNKKTTQKQLIEEFGLSQQVVSSSLNLMVSNGWVQAIQLPSNKESGRPPNSYQVIMSVDRVMDSILNDKKAKIDETIQQIAKLKKHFTSMDF